MASSQSPIHPIFYDIAPRGHISSRQYERGEQSHLQYQQDPRYPQTGDARSSMQPAPHPQHRFQTSLYPAMENMLDDPPPEYTHRQGETRQAEYQSASNEPLNKEFEQQLSLQSERTPNPSATPGSVTLPIVIPQTTKAFKGAFYSPFVRAYVPELESHGISQSDFMTFLDGLNECWIANPAFEGLNFAGLVMQQFYGMQIVQLTGLGVQVAAGLGSAATSYARTRAYVKAMNADFFHPAGLSANIKSTKDMMSEIGHSEQQLQLPPLEDEGQLDSAARQDEATNDAIQISPNDPRMRRMKALQGYVMPLDFNVPAAARPDNVLKRMGHAQAERLSKTQQKKLDKKRSKALEKSERKHRKADRRSAKGDCKVAELECQLGRERSRMEVELRSPRAQNNSKEQGKILRDFEKEEKKLRKDIEKEREKWGNKVERKEAKAEKRGSKQDEKDKKNTQKIRWIIIQKWDGVEDESDDTDEGSDESSSVDEREFVEGKKE